MAGATVTLRHGVTSARHVEGHRQSSRSPLCTTVRQWVCRLEQLSTFYPSLADRKLRNNGHALQVDGAFGTLTLLGGDLRRSAVPLPLAVGAQRGRRALRRRDAHRAPAAAGASGTDYLGGDRHPVQAKGQPTRSSTAWAGAHRPSLDRASPFHCLSTLRWPLARSCLRGGVLPLQRLGLTTPPCSQTVTWFVMADCAPRSARTRSRRLSASSHRQ